MKSKVLIIDDEKDICFLISEILKDESFETTTANTSDNAIEKFKTINPDLVILDVWLGKNNLDGIELLKKFKEFNNLIPIIIISGHGTVDMAVNAIKNGAYDFIEKPFNSEKLIILSKRAIENAKLLNENLILKKITQPQTQLIGNSIFVNELRKKIPKISNSTSRVFISGEMGSGKKLISQLIHQMSKRKDTLVNVIDFSNLDNNSLNNIFSENANNIKDNIFYRANNSTLILENIEKIPIYFQKKLLRYLDNNYFFKEHQLTLDLKIISLSSKNIIDEIENGNFLKDLFNRLNVVSIKIPPIKKRREDILPLCNYYLNFFNKNINHTFEFSDLAKSKLESYDWPGNIRQIVNYIEKTVILNQNLNQSENYVITDLPKDMEDAQNDNSQEKNFSLSLKEAREKFEKDYLLSQIKRFNGNMSKISEFTGMERTALYRKIKSLKIVLEKK